MSKKAVICATVALWALISMVAARVSGQPSPAIYREWEPGFTRSLNKTQDMALPAWGPYSTRFNGISHVPAENDGLRFDLIVQPSLYFRNITPLASTQRETGYHPWQASPDLSYFSYRFELEWKDRLYSDVAFSRVDDNTRLVSVSFVNNTGNTASMALNLFSSIMYPYKKRIKTKAPSYVPFISASDYTSFTDSIMGSNYNLVYDGQLRGQVKDEDAASKTAIIIGKNRGETLTYSLANGRALNNGLLLLRYRSVDASEARLGLKVNNRQLSPVTLRFSKDYRIFSIPIKAWAKGNLDISIRTLNKAKLALDGLMVAESTDVDSILFEEERINYKPKEIPAGIANAAVFKFDDISGYYGLIWDDRDAERRALLDDDPDKVLAVFNNLVKKETGGRSKTIIRGNNNGYFENLFSAPLVVAPGQTRRTYFYITYGNSLEEVQRKLKLLSTQWANAGNIVREQQLNIDTCAINKAGRPYSFSRQLMAATTLTNVNYPSFAANKYLKHTTPGKRWSAFYTWDAGFIGLGYTALNPGRALECLNAYTMDSTGQSAFLEHGTPLPVQAYLFNELWNQTGNLELLRYFYPRLKRFYNFLNGSEHSPTRKLRSNLLQTWDIFYNTGGWDDYSPQVYTHAHRLTKIMAPTVNTSHQIRFAKLLRMAAWQLGHQADMKQYATDIEAYSHALQQFSWDEASGYFSYVTHDKNGNAIGKLKHESGVNFNMGLDGVSPLIAGICNRRQTERIIDNIFTKGRLWTDQGITAIDQSAPYYNKDGYWNGRVWMPHQWFIWKALLDVGEPERAIKVAQTALDVWKRETESSYNCWENFSVETGNGGGWHQFGALSSPVLNWFSALYKPGTITHGLDLWPVRQVFNQDKSAFSGSFKLFHGTDVKKISLLVCVSDKFDYKATCDGKEIDMKKVWDGLYILTLATDKTGRNSFNISLKKK